MGNGMRYADSFDFEGRGDEYLRETFEIWGLSNAMDNDWAELYAAGRQAIIEELHGRALVMDEKREIVRASLSIPAGVVIEWNLIEQAFEAYQNGREQEDNVADIPAQLCDHGIDINRRCSICLEDARPALAPAVTTEVVPNAMERGQGFSIDGGKTWHAFETCDVGPTLTRVVREDGAFCFVGRGKRVLAQKIHDEAFADADAAHEVALQYAAIETGQYWRVRASEPGAGAVVRVSWHDGAVVWYRQNSGCGELKSVEIDTFQQCLEPVPGTMRGA